MAELSRAISDVGGAVEGLNDAFVDLLEIDIDQKLDELNKIGDAIESNKQKSIDAVNQLAISEEEKAKKIAQINGDAAQQESALEKQRRDLERQKAKLDREKSIIQIIQNTAVAVTSALSIPIYGEALAVIVAALGAAQLAKVLATPLPAYAAGTTDAKPGPSIVSEQGQELVVDKQGTLKLTPKTKSLVMLAGGETIYPADVTKRILAGIENEKSGVFNHVLIAKGNDNSELVEESKEQTRILKRLENKPGVSIGIYDNSAFLKWERRTTQS